VDWRGQTLRLVPGLRCATEAGVPDVMRGEETQVLGALLLEPALAERACIVMPGTHSKWACVLDGMLRGFATHMSGELFALLRQHSVLGRLMPADLAADAPPDEPAFAAGVRAARDQGEQGLAHQLFAVRSLGLLGRLAPAALPDYLSGLLIGHELRAGLAWRERAGLALAPLRLIGEPALGQRYAQALELFGLQQGLRCLPNTAAAGLWQLQTHLPC
jgi:2-dehydro-3-deoxygalactonokinase